MPSSAPFLSPIPRAINTEDLSQRIKDQTVSQPFTFSGFEFQKPVNFCGIRFENGVEFRRCIFHESVNFSGARFQGYARFWKCIFKKPADFKYAVFQKLETGALGSTENGEANLSWSRFEQDADFLWAKFEGPVFFWRTVFEKFAKLEATFRSSAVFEGDPRLVCIELGDLGSTPACLMVWIRLACFSRTLKITIAQCCLPLLTKMHSKKNSKRLVSTRIASIK